MKPKPKHMSRKLARFSSWSRRQLITMKSTISLRSTARWKERKKRRSLSCIKLPRSKCKWWRFNSRRHCRIVRKFSKMVSMMKISNRSGESKHSKTVLSTPNTKQAKKMFTTHLNPRINRSTSISLNHAKRTTKPADNFNQTCKPFLDCSDDDEIGKGLD